MEQNEKLYKQYLENQEKERKEVVNKITSLINDPHKTLNSVDAKEVLNYIDHNRLIAKDFKITKELFKILINELERVVKQGDRFEMVERELKEKLKEKEKEFRLKREDSQKRIKNIFQEPEKKE